MRLTGGCCAMEIYIYIYIFSSYLAVNTLRLGYKNQSMLYREIIAVCYQIHTKHTNPVWGQNVEMLNVKLVVYLVPTGL
jgi:hypothetical protein